MSQGRKVKEIVRECHATLVRFLPQHSTVWRQKTEAEKLFLQVRSGLQIDENRDINARNQLAKFTVVSRCTEYVMITRKIKWYLNRLFIKEWLL